MSLTYCKQCLYPETKPDFGIEDGICNGCRSYNERKEIDWIEREAEFQKILDTYRSRDGKNYDCIVPVSGGKDSTYQVIKLLEYGMHPLCITGVTDSLTPIGRRNIENIKNLGVDYIEYSFNPKVRRKLNRICLEMLGDISWPEHIAIFTTPVRMAAKLSIPLIVWGENSQNEYGGPAADAKKPFLDRRWLEEYGGLLGLRVEDLAEVAQLTPHDMIAYSYPSEEDLSNFGVTGLFLGHYFPWDGLTNALISQAHGFETWPHSVEGSFANYENLDNYQTGIHDYFKYLKFGFGRTTDIVCNHIRRGRLSRKDAAKIVAIHDGRYPISYLGRPLEEILQEIGLDKQSFDDICDRFTNKRIFQKDSKGAFVRREDGSPLRLNADND
jgi:N-acetyl sugar amidotransferase